MKDPFQMRRTAYPTTGQTKPRGLVDTSEDAALLRPRSPKLMRAILMLDTLTSGDDKLYQYLTDKAAQRNTLGEHPAVKINPFAARRDRVPGVTGSPSLSRELRTGTKAQTVQSKSSESATDTLDELLNKTFQEPIPQIGTQDFQALKDALLQKCQKDIQDEVDAQLLRGAAPGSCYLTQCGLVGHCIHSVSPQGYIIRHYRLQELDTVPLKKAQEILDSQPNVDCVEMIPSGDKSILLLTREDGTIIRRLTVF